MSLPDGPLDLQQAVRDLDKRISALETKHIVVTEEPGGQQTEAGSTPEPAKAD